MPQLPAPLLAVDTSPEGTLSEALRAAAREASFEVTVARSAQDALEKLEERTFQGVLIPTTTTGVGRLCAAIRASSALASTPVIGLSNDTSELGFAEFLGAGGDDVAGYAYEELVPRLRSVRSAWAVETPGSKASKRGVAVLGDADTERRGITARVLRGAGYEVRFAGSVEELALAAEQAGAVPSLYVVDAHLPPGGAIACIAARRKAGKREPWVVKAGPGELGAMRQSMRGLSMVGFHDAVTPAENIIFIANELARCAGDESRTSPRALYGTRCFLRAAGGSRETVGFTYNVSGSGLYVRTLYPFNTGDELWVELALPASERRVRLEAKVVWRRNFTVTAESIVPTGIALQITGGSSGDLERFRKESRAMAVELGLVSEGLASGC